MGLGKPLTSKRSIYNKVGFSNFSISTKNGPNGHAMQSIIRDFKSLNEEMLQDLVLIAGPRLQKSIELFKLLPNIVKPGWTRRITAISDKEGKTREIAILDY